MKLITAFFAALVAILVLAPVASQAASTPQELRGRFEQRYPKLKELKRSGKIGETSAGFLDVHTSVAGDEQTLVDQENADRTELYAQIAKDTSSTPQLVAERNARRNFDRADKGEYLKDKDGWFQKGARQPAQ